MKVVCTLLSSILLALASFSVNADYTADKGPIRVKSPQDIVITISKNPVYHAEEVCLALTMAQILRQSGPKVNVTVFLRNDGVFLADLEAVTTVSEQCVVPDPATPGASMEVFLLDNLKAFIDGDPNNLVNCPLCWGARVQSGLIENPVPEFGVLASEAVPPLLLGADKVIDF